MQNVTLCKGRRRIKWKDNDRKIMSLLYFLIFLFYFVFPSGIEASRSGFLTTCTSHAICAEAQGGSRLPASQAGGTNADDGFLHQCAAFTNCSPCGRRVLSLQFQGISSGPSCV